jgi:hypothetical protein
MAGNGKPARPTGDGLVRLRGAMGVFRDDCYQEAAASPQQ